MDAPDAFRDPRIQLSEAVREIRDAMHTLREGVVAAVTRRNLLMDEVAKQERYLADMDSRADFAEKQDNPPLAREIREERKRREAELLRLRQLLTEAEAAAESAKIRLPEEEARLLQQANDLQAQYARLTGAAVEANSPAGLGSETEAMWDRASAKVRDLQREASAREEVAGARGGQPTGPAYTPAAAPPSYERSAEEMLTAMESRLGLASPVQEEVQTPASPPKTYIAFDDAPATTPAALDPAPPFTAEAELKTEAQIAPDSAPEEEIAGVGKENAAEALPLILEEQAVQTAPAVIVRNKGDRARMEPKPRIRVAAIGTGNIFRGAHLPSYPDLAQAQLVAFCDPDKTAQDLVYKRYQSLIEAKIKTAKERNDVETVERLEQDLETVQICDDISEVIETVKPDLVDICTQPVLHAPLAIQALDAGINVMCEKPISRSWLESQRVIEAVKRSGKVYQHNENWLFEPDYYTVKKLVDSGAIGELIMMFLTQAHGGPEGNPRFWNSDFGGGGSLLDNGIHAIGAAWFVAGLDKAPTLVKAAQPFGMSIRMPQRIIDGRFQQVRVDDDAHILIRFEDKKTNAWSTAHVEGSWSEQDSPDTVYIGSTGKIDMLDEDGKRFAIVKDIKGRETRRFRVSGSNWQHWPSSFYGEIQNMVQCLLNKTSSIMTAEFGAECSAIVGASYLSEKDGKRAVHVDEFKQFALDIAARYPNDPTGADNALVDSLLAAVRDKK